MRKLLRFFVAFGVAAVIVVAVLCYGAYRASQHVPEFYEVALQAEPEKQAAAGDELEKYVLDLHNEVRETGQWEAVFTDEQINGWLAVDMPEKFSNALPDGVENPRVAINEEVAQIACRYVTAKVNSVISIGLEISLTDEPNVIAVRVRQARAGVLPLPLKQFLDKIAKAARRADLKMRWAQTDGDPVALVTVPTEHEQYMFRAIHIDSIELRDGSVYLAGRTEDGDAKTADLDSAMFGQATKKDASQL